MLGLTDVAAGTLGTCHANQRREQIDQGLTQVLQASVSRLEPMKPYILALSTHSDGRGPLEPLSAFVTIPAGAQILNAVGQFGRSCTQPRGQRGAIL